MKIGIISDIHGNRYALKQVLLAAKLNNIDKLLVLGDIVGYYYSPDVILNMLSEWPYEIVKGNHEQILQDLYNGKLQPDEIKRKYGSGHEQAINKLDLNTLNWLFQLPEQVSTTIDNVSFQLNHGSPWSIDEYLYPDATRSKLEQCNSLTHDFVLVGHSHYSFIYNCKNSTLINCGSVGQSRQKGGLANWAMVDTANKVFEIKATPYDTTELIEEIRHFDPHIAYNLTVLQR